MLYPYALFSLHLVNSEVLEVEGQEVEVNVVHIYDEEGDQIYLFFCS